MVAKDKEQGRGRGDLAEVVALGQVLAKGAFPVLVFVAHEGVAQVDVKVRGIREGVG